MALVLLIFVRHLTPSARTFCRKSWSIAFISRVTSFMHILKGNVSSCVRVNDETLIGSVLTQASNKGVPYPLPCSISLLIILCFFYIITTPQVERNLMLVSGIMAVGNSSYKESLVQQELNGWCMQTMCMFTANTHFNSLCAAISFYSHSQQDC